MSLDRTTSEGLWNLSLFGGFLFVLFFLRAISFFGNSREMSFTLTLSLYIFTTGKIQGELHEPAGNLEFHPRPPRTLPPPGSHGCRQRCECHLQFSRRNPYVHVSCEAKLVKHSSGLQLHFFRRGEEVSRATVHELWWITWRSENNSWELGLSLCH